MNINREMFHEICKYLYFTDVKILMDILPSEYFNKNPLQIYALPTNKIFHVGNEEELFCDSLYRKIYTRNQISVQYVKVPIDLKKLYGFYNISIIDCIYNMDDLVYLNNSHEVHIDNYELTWLYKSSMKPSQYFPLRYLANIPKLALWDCIFEDDELRFLKNCDSLLINCPFSNINLEYIRNVKKITIETILKACHNKTTVSKLLLSDEKVYQYFPSRCFPDEDQTNLTFIY